MKPWERALFSLYIAAAFCVMLLLNREMQIPGQTSFPLGPLAILGNGVYCFALPVFAFSLALHKIIPSTPKKTRSLESCLALAVVCWLFSSLAWLGSRLSVISLAHLFTLGGFWGIIEGVYRVPIVPSWIDNSNLPVEAKRELLKYEFNKWWQGLNIFWALIITAVVAGLLTYGATLPQPIGEAHERSLLNILIPAGCSVPGIAMIVWNVIKRTQYIQESLLELWRKRSKSSSSARKSLRERRAHLRRRRSL